MIAHLPTIKQLQYLVALRQHGHFGRAAEACFVTQSTLSAGLAGAREPARRSPGRADAPRGPLHSAGRRRSRKRRCGSFAKAEELTDMARARGQAAARGIAARRHPDDRAVPAAGDAPAAARAMAEPEALPARGDQPGRLRRAPSRPARLRPARHALRLRRRGQGALCSTTACSSPSRAAKLRLRPMSSQARSTRTAC